MKQLIIIGAGGMDTATLKKNIEICRSLTDKPFGVNIMLINPCADEMAQLVIDEKVPIVTTGAGNPGKYIEAWKAAGIKVLPVVPSVTLAKRLEKYNVDAIIVEGTEAGGHIGELTTMALVPQVVEAVNVPVVAAGGIATGEAMLAARVLGAEGVQIGTRFALTQESSAHEYFKEYCLRLQEGDTRLLLKKLAPVRLVRNNFRDAVEAAEAVGATQDELRILLAHGRAKKGIFYGDLEEGELEIGQASALLYGKQIETVAEVMQELTEGYRRAWDALKE